MKIENKMTRNEKLSKLENILKYHNTTNNPPNIQKISLDLDLSRQAIYKKGGGYREILEKFGLLDGKEKNVKIASKEYLLERIKKKDEEIYKLNKRIDLLNMKVINIQSENKEMLEKLTINERILMRIRIYYYELQQQYAAETGKNVNPFDIHDFEDNKTADKQLLNKIIDLNLHNHNIK